MCTGLRTCSLPTSYLGREEANQRSEDLTLGLVPIVYIRCLVRLFMVGASSVQVGDCLFFYTNCNSILFTIFWILDITEVALEWARKNVEANPHLSHLIEIRNSAREIDHTQVALCSQDISTGDDKEALNSGLVGDKDCRARVLVGVVGDSEEFDFCICNPPFFEHMEESGLNSKTSCGGTYEEMVYPGGELAFITRIIEESQELKQSFR